MNFSYSEHNLDRNPWVIYHQHQYMRNAIFTFLVFAPLGFPTFLSVGSRKPNALNSVGFTMFHFLLVSQLVIAMGSHINGYLLTWMMCPITSYCLLNFFLPGLLINLLLYIYSHLLIWISKFARALHVVLMGGGLLLIGLVSLHRHCMLC